MIALHPVGVVRGCRQTAEDDAWDAEAAFIEPDPRSGADALPGLDAFSHVEAIFHFRRADPARASTARATRAATRPGLAWAFSRRLAPCMNRPGPAP